ncbi:MAG: F0F1 ATP synthase subunit gamma [Nevskiales bacterium]|nr:F0F1 ATP synthase subunit gamma [Nevskiales bacterium]
MSRRREVVNRIGGLSEIREVLGAMKGLALVELRRVGQMIDAQRESVREIEIAAVDFLSSFRDAVAPGVQPQQDIWCVIGSERGFCGDFNAEVLAALSDRADGGHAEDVAPHARIVVGSRLAEAWPDETPPSCVVSGASVADEVPGVLNRILDAVNRALAALPARDAAGLIVVHQTPNGVVFRRLLPLPEPRASARRGGYPPELTLPPREYFAALADHYLHALLHEVVFDSLLEENQRRLQHMDRALHKLEEELDILQRRQNQLRQEDITEEIEVILLTSA